MSANYVVAESFGALVYMSLPYSRPFVTLARASSGKAYLILTVKTGYSDPSMNAVVTINGTKIGTIDPRPWTNHFSIDVETMIFVFDNTVLNPSFSASYPFPVSFPALQTLGIVLQGNLNDPNNYVIVGEAICHYVQA